MSDRDMFAIALFFVVTAMHAGLNAVILQDAIQDTCGEVAP